MQTTIQHLLAPVQEQIAARAHKTLAEVLDEEAGLPSVSLAVGHPPKPLILLSVEQAHSRKIFSLAEIFNAENLASAHPLVSDAMEADFPGKLELMSVEQAAKRTPKPLAALLQSEAEANGSELPTGASDEESIKTFNINLNNLVTLS